jgi:type IV secretory pathway VirB2 component (pilin)
LTPEAGQSPGGGDLSGSRDAGILDLGLALASVAAVAVARYYTAQAQSVPLAQTVRVISWSIVGGLASYLACVLGMPGVSWICGWAGIWGSALIPLAGCVAGLSLSMAVTRQA